MHLLREEAIEGLSYLSACYVCVGESYAVFSGAPEVTFFAHCSKGGYDHMFHNLVGHRGRTKMVLSWHPDRSQHRLRQYQWLLHRAAYINLRSFSSASASKERNPTMQIPLRASATAGASLPKVILWRRPVVC